MKVCVYLGLEKLAQKTGVATAVDNQLKALRHAGIEVANGFSYKYDLLHINSIEPKLWGIIKNHKKRGIPVVITAHTTQETHVDSFITSHISKEIFTNYIARLYNSVDCVIAPTEHVKTILAGHLDRTDTPIRVVSNGVDLEFFERCTNRYDCLLTINRYMQSRNLPSFSKDDKIVLSVGMPTIRKGFDEFVSVASLLPHYKFVWLGHTPALALPIGANIYRVKARCLRNVYLPGFVAKEVLRAFLSLSNIYLSLSKGETEGLALLEALSCNTPTVLRYLPTYDAWCKKSKCILLPESQSAHQLADLIDKYMHDSSWQDNFEAKYLLEGISLQKVGEKLSAVYNSLLNSD